MEQKRKIRCIIVLLLLGGCVVLLSVLNICIGSVSIPVFDILASIQGKAVENARILWDIRMPRMLAALILGGALGLAGYLLQTFFHNPTRKSINDTPPWSRIFSTHPAIFNCAPMSPSEIWSMVLVRYMSDIFFSPFSCILYLAFRRFS